MEDSTKTLYLGELWIGCFVLFLTVIGVIFLNTDNLPATAVSAYQKNLSSEKETGLKTLPYRLAIPQIKVEATIEPVGLINNDRMATPRDFNNAGWFQSGPRPGDVGNALIDGHVDNGFSKKGVFANLHKLKAGDSVYIYNDDSSVREFKVIETTIYKEASAPTETIFGKTERKLLRLITCSGDWNNTTKNYSDRLVVTAELISN